jgi:two-component system response regulator
LESQKILLVEDNPDDLEMTKQSLQRSNIINGLIVAEDGVEALKYFFGEDGRSGCSIDDLPLVVLLDLKLPRVDGLEVLRRMRSDVKTKLVPVIILTSSEEDKDVKDSFDLGASRFVRKPFHFFEFVESIQQLGLAWLIFNQSASNSIRKS